MIVASIRVFVGVMQSWGLLRHNIIAGLFSALWFFTLLASQKAIREDSLKTTWWGILTGTELRRKPVLFQFSEVTESQYVHIIVLMIKAAHYRYKQSVSRWITAKSTESRVQKAPSRCRRFVEQPDGQRSHRIRSRIISPALNIWQVILIWIALKLDGIICKWEKKSLQAVTIEITQKDHSKSANFAKLQIKCTIGYKRHDFECSDFSTNLARSTSDYKFINPSGCSSCSWSPLLNYSLRDDEKSKGIVQHDAFLFLFF